MNQSDLKYINLIGVEIEGGWKKKPNRLRDDGSVHGLSASYYGEVCSPPMTIDDVFTWIDKNTPTTINETCGTHIHISFNKITDYLRCMETSFFNHFLDWMDIWGKTIGLHSSHLYWDRLKGNNRFCIKKFDPKSQIYLKNKGGTRQTLLNFPYEIHKTIECRLFPAFESSDLYKKAVESFVGCVEIYLKNNKDFVGLEPLETKIFVEEVNSVEVI